VHAEVSAGDHPELVPHLLQRRRDGAVLRHRRGGHDHPVHPVIEGSGAEPLLGLPDLGHHRSQLLRRHGHRHLSQQPLGCSRLTGEAHAEQLADGAAAAVAADEVARAQPGAVGQLGGHAVLVLAQPGQLAAAPDLDAELGGVLGQRAVGGGLWDAEDVGMLGVQPVRGRLGQAGEEATDRVLLAELEKAPQKPRWSITSTLRAWRPSARTTGVGSTSFSSTTTCTSCSRNSLASINPVGPPPTTSTSIITGPFPAGSCLGR